MNTLLAMALILSGVPEENPADVIVVVGAAGGEEFGQQFVAWSERWRVAAEQAHARWRSIGVGEIESIGDREKLKQALSDVSADSAAPLWLVLIGHGTFDGRQAKFNLRGPDVSAKELNDLLAPIERPTVVVNCASASGPFINHLSAPQRLIVTATKSGYEHNFARFGEHISAAIVDPAADLDKDEQISLLEAFLAASARVSDFYRQEARLATEHALIDDNGDALGTPADWFRGVRATRTAKDGATVDGQRANAIHLVQSARQQRLSPELREQRDRLELEIEKLRAIKNELAQEEYYQRLELLFVELATLYAEND